MKYIQGILFFFFSGDTCRDFVLNFGINIDVHVYVDTVTNMILCTCL